mmetsp:Transcript_27033/g.23859  ORF Transcript_27033/g.23859 Transcript_27033/m.23859 type:complete len:180 (+) Transcript_27033:513-1052(+)
MDKVDQAVDTNTSRSVYRNLEVQHRKLTPHRRNNSLQNEHITEAIQGISTRNQRSLRCLPKLHSEPNNNGIINITTGHTQSSRKVRKMKKIVNIDIYNRKNSKAAIILQKNPRVNHTRSVQAMRNQSQDRCKTIMKGRIRCLDENNSVLSGLKFKPKRFKKSITGSDPNDSKTLTERSV